MICACERCGEVFESLRLLSACPQCGEGPVREASAHEKGKYRAHRLISEKNGIRVIELPLIIGWNHGEPVYAEKGIPARFSTGGEYLGVIPGEKEEVVSVPWMGFVKA